MPGMTALAGAPVRIVPPLDGGFLPLVLANRAFRNAVALSGRSVPVLLAVERADGSVSRYATQVFADGVPGSEQNVRYVERLIKSLLWVRGGWRIYIGGPRELGEAIAAMYAPNGARSFDYNFMESVYEHKICVVPCTLDEVPDERENTVCIGGHLDGCRIGFDAGASYRKVAAVIDGEVVFSDSTPWNPAEQSDAQYHFNEIMSSLRAAAVHLPRVDAIGVSTAGVSVNNRIQVSSLFRAVPKAQWNPHVTDLFLRIQQTWNGVPFAIANDGDVAALSGALSLHDGAVLGIAMGSSEAGGYVTPEGTLTQWLNELAFPPIDANPAAPLDEWSGDAGCGVQYLSQQAVDRLVPAAGFSLDPSLTRPERVKMVQSLCTEGDTRAWSIFETIGVYLGYALACYAEFYEMRHAIILGGVTSGTGGQLIIDMATKVLRQEFSELAETLSLHLPDESNRRVGAAIAAASLPMLTTKQ